MDLVDEQDVARLERGQDRGHVPLALQRRPRDAADADSEFLADDVGEARLAETRRADEQHVIQRFRPRTRCLERDIELLLDPVLPDEIVEVSRPERPIELVLLRLERRSEELLGHAAFSAWRTRSSGGASGSVPASARSASTAE